MMTTDYKGNSNRSKELREAKTNEEKRKLQKVVKGKVRTKKKSGTSRFMETFLTEDLNNVKSYVIGEVLIPAAKKALSDIVTNGIDMILYGEAGASRRRESRSGSRVSYQRYYDDDRRDRRDRDRERYSVRSRSGYNFDDIIFDTRGEAENVLIAMEQEIDNYGIVSVADLYELVGITGNYTDNKYGWTSLNTADVIRCRDGYTLRLPRALPID